MAVRVERSDRVWTVIIDRPETRNAVDRATADALAEAFRAFEADDDAAVAVLWGAGGTFCSGADLKAFAADAEEAGTEEAGTEEAGASGPKGNRVEAHGDGPLGPTRMLLGKPVIAAVSGHAVAGGLELAIWCDLRVVEQDAVFGVYCRRWGVPLVDGGTVRLPRLIGTGRALDLILTGRPVDAAEAHRIGLADRLVPTGTARAAAEELAAQLAALPQECLRNDRLSVYDSLGRPVETALAIEYRYGVASLAAGAREGAERFATGEGRHGARLG
jgi:enoyl-CoA hydratase